MNESELLYFRPKTMIELEKLMKNYEGRYLFLTGGDYNTKGYQVEDVLIDLQDLSLDLIEEQDQLVEIGGLVPLDKLFKDDSIWADFREALSIEGGWNIRNGLSVDNFLRVANGRSPLLICLRALDIEVLVQPEIGLITLDDYLASEYNVRDYFIERIRLTKPKSVAYEQVARTPKDLPIVCVAVVQDLDGSVIVTVGGHEDLLGGLVITGDEPIDPKKIRELFDDTDDEWASGAYRQDVAEILFIRCLEKLGLR